MGILRTNTVSGLETPTPVTGSVVFDGSGDYLEIPNSSDLEFGNNSFTIEAWLYPVASGGSNFNIFYNKGVALQCYWKSDTNKIEVYADSNNTSNYDILNSLNTPSGSIISGQWTHIAIVRNINVFQIYLNGIASGSSITSSASIGSNSNGVTIGDYKPQLSNYEFNGYISNLRILKGTALYTSNFTPPTRELQPIGDTVLLCCNNSTSATAEATGKTITVNGNAAASTFSPGLVRDFTYGTQFDGVSKFDTQGYFVPPSGNTQNRYTLGLNEIVTSGLVLHLDAGNPLSYPVTGVGTYWNDLSGNNNHGILYNGVSYTENNRGALVFDGNNDSVDLGTTIPPAGNLSVFAWVYPTTFQSFWNLIVSKWFNPDQSDFHWALVNDGTNVKQNLYTTFNASLSGTATFSANNWYYVGFTLVNGGTLTFYKDGVSDGTSSTVSRTTQSSTLRIGDARGVNYGLKGNIAQVSIYNRVLTAAEVLQNYNALKGRYCYT